MNEIINTKSGLISIIHKNEIDLPKPFEKNIYLFTTKIAGVSYIQDKEVLNKLKIDDELLLFREPQNKHDKKAIVIKTSNLIKLGYIPRANNVVFARLMDAGKLLIAKIKDIEYVEDIYINIYLKD